MRDLLVLLVHFLTTLARLLGPGGTRAVIAETLLIKHQLVILNRSRRRAPNLTAAGRIVMGLCTLFMNPSRIRKVAAALKPATLLGYHRALKERPDHQIPTLSAIGSCSVEFRHIRLLR